MDMGLWYPKYYFDSKETGGSESRRKSERRVLILKSRMIASKLRQSVDTDIICWTLAKDLKRTCAVLALLKKLQSLQETDKQQAPQREAPGVSTTSSNMDSHETGNEQSKCDSERQEDFSPKLIQQSIQRGADRFYSFLYWFGSMKRNIGRLHCHPK